MTNLSLYVQTRNAVSDGGAKLRVRKQIDETLELINKHNEEYKSQTGNYYVEPADIDRIINIPAAPKAPPPPPPAQKLRPLKPKKETFEEELKPASARRITNPPKQTTKPRVSFAAEPEIKTETTKKKETKKKEIKVEDMKLTKEMQKDAYAILDLIDERNKLDEENKKEKDIRNKTKNNSILYAQKQEILRKSAEYGENYKQKFSETALRAYRELHSKPKEEPKEEKPKTESPKKVSPKKDTKEEKPKTPIKEETPKEEPKEEKPAKKLTDKQKARIRYLQKQIDNNTKLFWSAIEKYKKARQEKDLTKKDEMKRLAKKLHAEKDTYISEIEKIQGFPYSPIDTMEPDDISFSFSPVKPTKTKK